MPYRIVLLLVPLAALIAWLVWKSTRPTTFNSLPRPVLYALIGVLSIVFLQQAYMEFRWISTERTATEIAQRIAGKQARVHCQRMTEAMFYASGDRGRVEMNRDGSPDDTAMLTWEVCRDLRDWLGSDRQHPSLEQITALHILTHEAVHLTGESSEGRAECVALAQEAAIAEQFGASPDVAKRMVRRYRNEVYPLLATPYLAGNCPAV